MRLGKVLEDLDALAGNIAFFHVVMQNQQQTNNNNSATTESFVPESEYPVIVTASVDRIRLHSRPRVAGSDQHLSGQVTWTGTSSMEIRMTCTETTTPSSETTHPWLEAYVTFVTLDPHTKKPRRIPAIVPVTEEEKREFAQGEARAEAKKQRRKRNHQTSSSNQDDSSNTVDTTAQALLAQAGPLLTMPSLADPHSILLKDTVMQNAMIAQPQAQNLHNRIFGGFLVRRAFELAFANAYLFGGARPIFLEVDEVSFARPVDVGDLLVFHSRVLYTENKAGHLRDYYQQQQPNDDGDDNDKEQDTPIGALIHIEVEAWVTEPEKVSAHISNQFYFTFAVAQKPGQTSATPAVRKVLPSNIDEARRVAIRMQVDAEQAKCDP